MRRSSAVLPVLLVTLALCTIEPACAQHGASAGTYGSGTDAQGAILRGAAVRLFQLATGQTRVAVTNEDGEHKFSLLPVGGQHARH